MGHVRLRLVDVSVTVVAVLCTLTSGVVHVCVQQRVTQDGSFVAGQYALEYRMHNRLDFICAVSHDGLSGPFCPSHCDLHVNQY